MDEDIVMQNDQVCDEVISNGVGDERIREGFMERAGFGLGM